MVVRVAAAVQARSLACAWLFSRARFPAATDLPAACLGCVQ